MSEPARKQPLTAEDLLAMGDIGPCELIDGRVVPMSPTGAEHGQVESTLARLLGNFVEANGLGRVLTGEVGIVTRRSPDRVRGADVVFLSAASGSRVPSGFLETPPDLVVEVISPSDRWQDTRETIEEYFAMGVRQVWIVEPRLRTVLVHDGPTAVVRLASGEVLRGTGPLAGFELPVSALFPDPAP